MQMCFAFLLLFIPGGISQGSEQIKLECLPSRIRIVINDSFFHDVSVTNATQIHFNDNPQCHARRIESGYELNTPFGSCGTLDGHDGENYIFNNYIVLSSQGNTTTAIAHFTCEYEDQYTVSSNNSLLPYPRILHFVTSRGQFSVEMSLFQQNDYHPDSKIGHRPRIIAGVPIYVSIDMLDVFGTGEIATTLQSCYATSMASHDEISEENHHHLIVGRCSSPDDESVQIYSNGLGAQSRFSFQTFQWRNQAEYFYIHCEVYLCNRTAEECSGTEVFCNGSQNGDTTNRRKRAASSNVEGNRGFISAGPIQIVNLQNGTASLQTNNDRRDVITLEERNERSRTLFLKYVLGSVGVVLGIICIFLLIFIIMRKSKNAQKHHSSAENSGESLPTQ